jgi:general secretion pathway protein J
MRNDSQAGMTLIEILIAVSLLSLLSVGMLVAMRLGFSTMDKTDTRLVANRRVANTRAIIENEINGFIYSRAYFQPGTPAAAAVPFFETQPTSMRFVTSYSIEDAWRGRAQIAVLQVIPVEKGQGVRLIVNETPWTGTLQAGQQIAAINQGVVSYMPVEPGPNSFVLADHLSYCRFSYLEPLREAPFQRWRPDWIPLQQMPLAVRIEMAPLDSSANSVQMGTVTVPLQVNRVPGLPYTDAPTRR